MDVDWSKLEGLYQQGVEYLSVGAPPFQVYQPYLEKLLKWNQVYNLTAVREPDAMLKQHILESLAVLPYLIGNTRLDVGTGAGVPGLVLALAEPQSQWHLLDANSKKTRFVQQMVIELQIDNVTIYQERFGDHQNGIQYDVIISRGFADVFDFYSQSKRFVNSKGKILAMKRGKPENELDKIQKTINFSFHYLAVLDNERAATLIEIKQSA